MNSKIRHYGVKAEVFLSLNFCSVGLHPVPVVFHIIMEVMRQDGCIIPCPFPLPGDTISDASPKIPMKFCF